MQSEATWDAYKQEKLRYLRIIMLSFEVAQNSENEKGMLAHILNHTNILYGICLFVGVFSSFWWSFRTSFQLLSHIPGKREIEGGQSFILLLTGKYCPGDFKEQLENFVDLFSLMALKIFPFCPFHNCIADILCILYLLKKIDFCTLWKCNEKIK